MHTYMVKLLLDRCASICARIFGDALQIASVHGHTGVVQVLLNRGADVNAGGVFYGNALQMAYDSGRMEAVQLLLNNNADTVPSQLLKVRASLPLHLVTKKRLHCWLGRGLVIRWNIFLSLSVRCRHP